MAISIVDLDYIYDTQTQGKKALDSVNIEIPDGQFVGIIGHTGSGKSTLIQHINGLLTATAGKIIVSGLDITMAGNLPDKTAGDFTRSGDPNAKKKKKTKKVRLTKKQLKLRRERLLEVRRKVGIVFQYPEYQLFEETVEKDVAFGPKNLGYDDADVARRVKQAMEVVGLDYEETRYRSPFDLSGGQKRRVAIAGVIAMEPEVLILDEPTAGLDPKGREDILNKIQNLHSTGGRTVIMVSHSMDDMAKIVDRLIVMNEGRVAMDGRPYEIFQRADELYRMGLDVPDLTKLLITLKNRGLDVDTRILNVDEACTNIKDAIKRRNGGKIV